MEKERNFIRRGLYMALCLLCVSVTTVFASSTHAEKTKFSIDMKEKTVAEVLEAIEQRTGFHFFYNTKLIDTDNIISVNLENQDIFTALNQIFNDSDVEYKVIDKDVILTTAEAGGNSSARQAQQQRQVTGRVSDAGGTPLAGVLVTVVGTSTTTITDGSGAYTLQGVPAGATLQFSILGMSTREITVGTESIINATLDEDIIQLEQVVAIGYGTMRKSDLTGAVASVSADEIKNYAVTNLQTALVGKLAGVYASTNSGQPGSGAAIRIRGVGTVNDNNPLYVVDGMFMDNINDLNPNDIERIEVLKDASSTAIYGSRGANGVLLITTKKGVDGLTVSVDSYVGISSSIFQPEMSNSEQLYNFITESYINDGMEVPAGLKKLYDRGVDTDWWDVTTKQGLTQNHNVSIRGGSEKLKSALSVGYVSEDGFIKNTDYYRLTLHSYLEYQISKWISVGANLNVSENKSMEMRGFYEPIWQITSADPFSYVYNPEADPSDPEYRYNRYAATEYAYTNNPLFLLETNNGYTKRTNTYGNVFANVNLLPGLSYNVQYSFNKPVSRSNNFDPLYSLTPSDLNMANLKYRNYNRVTTSQSSAENTMWQQTLSYDKRFGENHNLNAVLGVTYENNNYYDIAGSKNTTPGNGEQYWVLDAATDMLTLTGARRTNSILSYLGRINYTYANKYLLTASFRADGSSRFAKSNRWGYFPSFSLGWRLSEENFFKNLNLSWMSYVKLRVGWGQTGNQSIPNNATITTIGTANNRIYVIGDTAHQAYGPTNMGNSTIRWEVSEQTNFGLDAALFNNKLELTFDYYTKKTKDMLLNLTVPSLTGYPNSPWVNAGSIQNTGFDFSAIYRGQAGDFSYSAGINLSTYKNKVLSLGSGNEPIYYTGLKTAATVTEVGAPVAQFYGYKYDGIFQNQSEVDAYVNSSGEKLQPLAKPGDFRFADIDGNGVLNADDRTYIGNPHPDLIFGINFSGSYKNFDLSFAFTGTTGNDMWNEYSFKGFATSTDNVPLEAYTNAWRKEGDQTKFPRISQRDENNNARSSSFYVENGSYIRLKNIQLGYTLPQSFTSKIGISSCRFYVSGQNVFTLTKYGGMDPEVGANDDVMTLGIESRRYPSSRIGTVGVNITF